MNVLAELKSRFAKPLTRYQEDPASLLDMIRPSDGKFGDYQANCAMPLGKKAGRPTRDVASEIVSELELDGLCESVDIAGPGFINLKLDAGWLNNRLKSALSDPRMGVEKVASPRKFVVDFSSPNVAKPMHVGHIRSTVIGNAIAKILKFAGHNVITDNHLGDWGTQFGMIIYGYKHFLDEAGFEEHPIQELGRLYKMVRRVMDYHAAKAQLPETKTLLEKQQAALERLKSDIPDDKKAAKKVKKDIKRLEEKIQDSKTKVSNQEQLVESVDSDSELHSEFVSHAEIGQAVLDETAKLHDGDAENKTLWEKISSHLSRRHQSYLHEVGRRV